MTAWFRFVLSHRALVLGLVAAITALSVASASRATFHSSIQELFFGDSPAFASYLERTALFVNDDVALVAIEDPDPLSVESLDRLDRVVALLEQDPEVARVEGIHRAARMTGTDGQVVVRPYAELAREAPEAREALLEAARQDPLVGSVLLSPTARAHLLIVETVVDPSRDAETRPRLLGAIRGAMAEAGYAEEAVHYGGFPSYASAIMQVTIDNLYRLMPLSLLVLFLTGAALFRRLTPALLTIGVSLLAMSWTMGLMVALNPQLNLFASVVPSVVIIVGFSDVVHLWSAYLTERRAGVAHDEAILASATDVGRACLLTSATTFVGFVSISFVPTPVFRQLGAMLGFGVAVALLLAMTLVPIALSYLPPPEVAPEGQGGWVRQAMDRLIDALAGLSFRHPWPIIAGFLALAVASLVGLSGLQIETDFAERMDPDSEVRQDLAFLDAHFAGSSMVELYVDAAEVGGVLEPDFFLAVARAEAELEAMPDVSAVTSLVDVVAALHPLLTGEPGLPETREALAQYLLLFELSGGQDLDRLVDFDRRTLRLGVRARPTGIVATYEVGERAEATMLAALPPGATAEATGFASLLGGWLDDMLAGQVRGLGFSFVVISILMVLGLGSIRDGLWSMVPNTLPIVALGGGLALVYPDIDSDTLIIGMIALGIGVDDTVHFLMRFKVERQRSGDVELALRNTFRFAGRAIVMTTIILSLGFLPFALSTYYSVWVFGTWLPAVLVMALAADLLLVPAMVRVGLMGR